VMQRAEKYYKEYDKLGCDLMDTGYVEKTT
jgi:hypothetical protein